MSDDFLSCIKSFSKSTLVPVSTVVTLTTGVKYELSAGETTCTKLQERGAGFVVDDKPDLTVGIVLPHLLLGSMDVAGDRQLMQSLSVTHILNCCPTPHSFPEDFVCMNLQMLDVPEYEIQKDMIKAFEFVESSRSSSGRCLVHCNAGISRCTSLVIAYLICVQKMSFEDAFRKVKYVYPKARPNAGFISQLKKLNPDSF